MAPDGNSSRICSFELNRNWPSIHEVEGSKHAVKNGNMASDGNSSAICSLELNSSGPSEHEVEGSKRDGPAEKNGSMTPDGDSSTICSLELSPNGSSVQEVEASKHVAPVGKNGASMIRMLSFEGPVSRTVSDVSVELSRSSANLHGVSNLEVEKVQCECCGISEECTPTYICRVRDLFCGHWVCGLCAEAVKEEQRRIGKGLDMEDALRAHMAVCVKFNQVARLNPALYLADAMRELLKKSSRENGFRSNPNSPRDIPTKKTMSRSASCIPAMVGKGVNQD